MTPAELERSVENLRSIIQRILDEMDRLKASMTLTEAGLSHHKHDFTRDVTGQPTTYAPSTHTHAAYADVSHTHAAYADVSHTHAAYASNTHAHDYQDSQVAGASADVSRTTGGPV
jgi:hypothetical protein